MSFYYSNWSKRGITLGISFLLSTSCFAIDSLSFSLDSILAKALLNSKYIEQSLLEKKKQEVLVQQKRVDLLPVISLRGSASYATNMPIYDKGIFNKPSQHEAVHYLYDTGADFYLNLYNGHRDLMQIKSQKLIKEIANIDWLSTIATIKLDVSNLFLDMQLCYSNKVLIINDIADQKEQLKEIQNLYNAGVVLHSDVLRIELELSKREILLLRINNDMEAINKQLQLITGIDQFIVPTSQAFNKTISSYEDILVEAKKSAFLLLKSEQEVFLSELEVKEVKSNYLPTVGVVGNYTFANPQIFLYPYNTSWYSLGIFGLKATIPISSLYNNKNKVRASKLSLEKEKVKHHHEEEKIENKLLQAHLDYKLAVEEMSICQKNVELAKENARIIKNRYFKSAALITDLLDADMQLLQTFFELESSKIAIQKQYYFIEFIKGTI